MKHLFTIAIVFSALVSLSQKKLLFNDLYEIRGEQTKVYLDAVYNVCYKKCADYYMLCKIDNKLEYTDSVYIYDLDDNLIVNSYFRSSKLDGVYREFYANGHQKATGHYKNGLRVGIWKFFHKKGQLKKTLDFGEGVHYPTILDFYDKKGTPMIISGNGNFEDSFCNSIATSAKMKYEGNILDGKLNGSWKIKANRKTIGTETFKEGEFIEGVSISIAFGNQKYYDRPKATIYGFNYLERVRIYGPSYCNYKSSLNRVSHRFFNELQTVLSNHINEFNYSWFFIEIHVDRRGNFKEVFEIPKNPRLNSIITEAFNNKEIPTVMPARKGTKEVIILQIKDGVYFSNSEKTNNFILQQRL